MKAKRKKEMKKEKKERKKLKKLKKLEEKALVPTVLPIQIEKPAPFLELWQNEADDDTAEPGPVMTDEQKARLATKRPITKEEYDAKQAVIRRVVDPESGRTRLVRGEGEIIEEMVSREKHKDINKQATKGDGKFFASKLGISR